MGHRLSINKKDKKDRVYRILNYHLSPSLREPCRGLLIAKCIINKIPSTVLFDNGCEDIVISEDFAKKNKLQLKSSKYKASMANGSSQNLKETVYPISVSISQYHENLQCMVSPLQSYDLILGKIWLSQYDPVISHRTNQIEFFFQGRVVEIDADIEKDPRLISVNSIEKDLKSKVPIFAIVMKSSVQNESNRNCEKTIQKVLD